CGRTGIPSWNGSGSVNSNGNASAIVNGSGNASTGERSTALQLRGTPLTIATMTSLVAIQGPEAGKRHVIDQDCTVLGREIECAICLDGRAVSRQHVQILLREQRYFVEDLGSSNGTFLNHKRL